METNILLIADTHRSQNSQPTQRRWWPGHVSNLPPDRQLAYLHQWDGTTSAALNYLLAAAKSLGPFSSIVSLGDNTSGDNEEGLLTQAAQDQWQDFKALLSYNLSGAKEYFVIGGHDCGYNRRRNIETVLAGFRKAQEFLGPLWQIIRVGKYVILCLNSEVYKVAARFRDPALQNMAKEQTAFLARELREANGNVILAIHDPAGLNRISSLLKLYNEKIILTLAGHLHLKAFNRLLWLTPLFRYIHLRIVPSPWGLATPWGPIGHGGFCTLTLRDDSFALNFHRL